jgi:hypothetical protein
LTESTLPARAAVIRTVSPPGCDAFASAPAASRALTRVALPFIDARDSGGTP